MFPDEIFGLNIQNDVGVEKENRDHLDPHRFDKLGGIDTDLTYGLTEGLKNKVGKNRWWQHFDSRRWSVVIHTSLQVENR